MDELVQYMMPTKRKCSMSSSNNLTSSSSQNNHYHSSSYDESSWEEKAFAKDASGFGCIWPQRSYSCSFCRREFRSAQALGGHMNVHRRDRAKLNHHHQPQLRPISPQQNETRDHVVHHQYPLISGYLYPSSLCETNPNYSDPPPPPHVIASSSKGLTPSSDNMDFIEETQNIPLHNSCNISSKSCLSNMAESGSVERISKGLLNNNHKTDVAVSMNLNLFVCRAYTPMQFIETKEEDLISFKKMRKDASIPLFTKQSSVDDTNHIESHMFELSPSSIEELDLELRLGYRPKIRQTCCKLPLHR